MRYSADSSDFSQSWLLSDEYYGRQLYWCSGDSAVDAVGMLWMLAAGYFRNVNNIDLNAVRLCFQVFLPDANKKFTHIVQPIVSQPIIDKSLF